MQNSPEFKAGNMPLVGYADVNEIDEDEEYEP